MVLEQLYICNNGQELVEFVRGGRKDWFIWSSARQQRVCTFRTKKELMSAYRRMSETKDHLGLAYLPVY